MPYFAGRYSPPNTPRLFCLPRIAASIHSKHALALSFSRREQNGQHFVLIVKRHGWPPFTGRVTGILCSVYSASRHHEELPCQIGRCLGCIDALSDLVTYDVIGNENNPRRVHCSQAKSCTRLDHERVRGCHHLSDKASEPEAVRVSGAASGASLRACRSRSQSTEGGNNKKSIHIRTPKKLERQRICRVMAEAPDIHVTRRYSICSGSVTDSTPTEDRDDKYDLFLLLHTLGIRRGFSSRHQRFRLPKLDCPGMPSRGLYHHSGFVRIQDTHR